MPRVSKEAIAKLSDFFESLPEEARNKCSICNETLTHLVKTAEVETGAGTATVARILAEKINEKAAPQDKITPGALRDRVRREEGTKNDKTKMADRPNKNPPPKIPTFAEVYQEAEKRVAEACLFLWKNHPGAPEERIAALKLLLEQVNVAIENFLGEEP